MSKAAQTKYEPVDASPVKSFFVHMLTRDIKLEEAILDLLDNCVDGILRSGGSSSQKEPYSGFWAKIDFDETSFSISDNCGGIPWNLHEYAFKMGRAPGRPTDEPGTVGVYGIGMKRAIFKMGKECLIHTQNGRDVYDVDIQPEWTDNEDLWKIPVRPSKQKMAYDGTTIVVGNLHPGIATRFGEDAASFKSDLKTMVATHYVFIMDKGFQVRINGDLVKPRPIRLIFDKKSNGNGGIRPFIFKTSTQGVDVFLAVGFTRPIPSADEVSNEQEDKRYSSQDAGWTVVCNDRAVLYCDRSELTGWGEAGVPRYHTQFIAVSGIVEFRSDDASKLPTTTTKRGIDASSPLYLQIKNKMREGMRMFTDYTNKWKGRADESREQMEAATPMLFEQIKAEAGQLNLRMTKRSVPQGAQYKPMLPLPKKLEPRKRRVCFVKEIEEINAVSEYLFESSDRDPSEVGEECFDLILRDAKK